MIGSTRRNFIKRTVAATGTLGFAAGCRSLQVTDRNDFGRDAIDRLRAKVKGRLIVPTDPSYENARRVFYWNAATERMPRAIVHCASEDDALRAVEFARLTQIASLLNLEKVGEVLYYWGDNNSNVTWRLTPAEVRRVLSRRVDFSPAEIAALKL